MPDPQGTLADPWIPRYLTNFAPKEVSHRFADVLTRAGVLTFKRTTRGDDIDAACGQLAGDIEDKSRRHVKFMAPRFGEQVQ